ncbi:MAG TPA: hypothetical protein VGP07_20060 [Polyangia bacterium]
MAKKPAPSALAPSLAPPSPLAASPPTGDVAMVFGKDEHGTHILRRRSEDAPIEAGVLRPLRSGKPIDGEVVSLSPRTDGPLLFDVKSELPSPLPRSSEGPAQVASDAYRKGWDAVWGRRRRDRTLN